MNTGLTTRSLLLEQLYDRDSCTYTYLLIDPETNEGAIIDPVWEHFDRDLQIISERGIELLYSIETHAHADHVTSGGKLRQMTGAKIVFGENAGIQSIDISIKHNQELKLGNFTMVIQASYLIASHKNFLNWMTKLKSILLMITMDVSALR